jgi:hypothetical protein
MQSNRRNISVAARSYIFSPVGPELLSYRHWAVISCNVVDELTTATPRTPLSISTDFLGLKGKVAADGIIGLVGRPWEVFPPLLSPSYDVEFEVRAPGYIPHRQVVTVSTNQRSLTTNVLAGSAIIELSSSAGIQPGQFLLLGPPDRQEILEVLSVGPGPSQVTLVAGPEDDHSTGDIVVVDFFDTIDLGSIELRRDPVVIQGRIVALDPVSNESVPVPAATVSITNLWRQPIPATGPTPPADDPVVYIQPSLYADRSTTDDVRVEDMAPVLGDPKSLVELAEQGDTQLYLSNSQGLSIGDTLMIDFADSGRTERISILNIGPAVSVTQPTLITLEYPVKHAHRVGAIVYRGLPGAIGPQRQISVSAYRGDACVFVNDVTGIPAGQVATRVFGGASADEYHQIEKFVVSSDADGYYKFPPLSRVAELRIHAERLPASADVEFRPNYAQRENRLDILLT